MIGGAAEWYVPFINYFKETDTHFIARFEDIDVYFKKANNLSYLVSNEQLVTHNKTMSGKSIYITQVYVSWAYFTKLPESWL
jgi:hypothetical protein